LVVFSSVGVIVFKPVWLRLVRVVLWDIKTGYELRRLERAAVAVWGIHHIKFSPDGQFLVSANDDTVRLWNVSKIPESKILIQPTRQPESRAKVTPPEVKKAPPIPAFEEKPSKSPKFLYALIGVAIIVFLLFAIFPKREATTPTSTPKVVFGIISTKVANIRSAPSPNSAVISKAQLGDTVVVVSESSEWLFVKHKNKEGYISAKLVKQ
jgi:WD40 repeat protein